MNADEIVKALERMAPQFQAPGREVINGAANLIESLQAQLAEGQRREKAAVDDMKGLARFEKERCAYCLYDEECEPGEMLCSYKGDKAFEWRGPQKDGKGG